MTEAGLFNCRGELLAVGGVREKVEAARKAGCRLVIVPAGNAADVEALCDAGLGGETGQLAAWVRDHVVTARDMIDVLVQAVQGE